ncbi:MAG TPA: cytochrome c oxidase subunit 3 [Rhizomicrobium sp.]|jgi:cytochrome c oxidase subunit 3|nr:cytochrome c oxidase subunit 3 [Rhizomicrobium sp.]
MSDAFLRPPFENLQRQHQAVAFGMWIFLVSEVLLFAGLFAGYTVYRDLYPQGFLAAGRQTDIVFGTVNTAILMTSSLTMAVAGRASRAGFGQMARRLLIATFTLGALFLVLKGLEYREDIQRHLVPGAGFALAQRGAQIFFSYYWIMTGVHAVHVTAGLIAVMRLIVVSRRNVGWLAGSASEDATALYWHLVDVIWIVLYPLLYLVGRANG